MKSRMRKAGVLVVPAVGAAMVLAGLGPAGASSHKEAPLTSQDPVIDATDLFAFVSPNKPDSVTFVANYVPFENPPGGPHFDRFGDDVLYRINVDNNGDAVPDIKYDFRFNTTIRNGKTFLYATGPITAPMDANVNIYQSYSVARTERGVRKVIRDGISTAPANVGPVSTPNYESTASQAAHNIDGKGMKVFAGPRDDPFFVDLGAIFDLGQLRPFLPAYKPAPRDPQRGKNGTHGFNVQSIVLQVPITDLTSNHKALAKGAKDPHAVIGITTTSYRFKTRVLTNNFSNREVFGSSVQGSGPFVQVSRLGNPLVNELVIPLKDQDRFNASQPRDDAQFAKYVLDPEPARLINALFGLKVPSAPRTKDLVPIFLTGIPGLNMPPNVVPSEQLRLNMGIGPSKNENPLGVLGGDLAGYPNGRRLGDDVVDIELRALAGGTPFTPSFNVSPNNDLGDGVNSNDRPFLGSFPYVGVPNQGYKDVLGSLESSTTPKINP